MRVVESSTFSHPFSYSPDAPEVESSVIYIQRLSHNKSFNNNLCDGLSDYTVSDCLKADRYEMEVNRSMEDFACNSAHLSSYYNNRLDKER